MRRRTFFLVGTLIALVLAGIVSFYASSQPDGLERVATDHGFLDSAEDSVTADSPLGDYQVRGIDDPRLSGGLAGVTGVLVTAAAFGGLYLLVRRRGNPDDAADEAKMADDTWVADEASTSGETFVSHEASGHGRTSAADGTVAGRPGG